MFLAITSASPVMADFDAESRAYESSDFATALREFMPLAEQGDAKAQYRLGGLYKIGIGVSKNGPEAVKWLLMAAEQGYPKARIGLEILYDDAKNVPRDATEAAK